MTVAAHETPGATQTRPTPTQSVIAETLGRIIRRRKDFENKIRTIYKQKRNTGRGERDICKKEFFPYHC